ncbi:MAG: hypothetical protein ACT4O5_10590 [Gammaproteobacteria bacterium]
MGIAVLCAASIFLGERSGATELTTATAIETTRAATASFHGWVEHPEGGLRKVTGAGSIVLSPDGKRYALKLVRGDIQHNGVWAEILVGGLQSFEAAKPRAVARFFTQAYGSTDGKDSTRLVLDGWNALRWSPDSELLLHLWEDERGVKQVVSIDSSSGKVRYLTANVRDVLEYALSADNDTLLYAGKTTLSPPARHAELLKEGFVVTNPDVYSLISGKVDRGDVVAEDWNSERFVVELAKQSHVVRIDRPGDDVDTWIPLFGARISPDGRFAIVDGTPQEIPAGWESYRGTLAADYVRSVAVDATSSSRSGYLARQAKQLYVVDLKGATSRLLWSAPVTRFTAALWRPDSRSIILAPTFLPAELADSAGLQGTAVVEIDIATGHFARIPLASTASNQEEISALRWVGTTALEIERAGQLLSFAKHREAWRATGSTDLRSSVVMPIRMELRQDMNTPPVLYAVDQRTGEQRAILDLNPGLGGGDVLGRAELVTWEDSNGLDWTGLLYYPINYDRSKRYPLVIQTHGHAAPTEFSLYGSNLGLGLGPGTSIYAGRLLSARGIAVLTIQDQEELDTAKIDGEAERYMHAYESAARHLAQKGLIELSKVGVSGFSRTGWHVEYALAHSEFPFAAAITSDNVDGNYLQATASPSRTHSLMIGSPPFAEGLAKWLQQSPAFNAQRIRTPLRLMIESAGLEFAIAKWEMFSRLRQLNRPVEFFVIPEINRGSHGVQNPAQVFATQQSTVDWFDFWLNDQERVQPLPDASETAESLAQQYLRWRRLREQRDAMLKELRPPRLRWTADPVEESAEADDLRRATGNSTVRVR